MRIAFVIDRIGFLEKFSIPIVAAISRHAGYKTKVVEFYPDSQKAITELKQFRPDVIGYSVSSIESESYLKVNRILKEHLSFFSLFGGPHPTFFPSFIKAP